MAGWLISNGSASSITEASPCAKRARMARRVGSARAAKVTSSWREVVCITVWLHNLEGMYSAALALSSPKVLQLSPTTSLARNTYQTHPSKCPSEVHGVLFQEVLGCSTSQRIAGYAGVFGDGTGAGRQAADRPSSRLV